MNQIFIIVCVAFFTLFPVFCMEKETEAEERYCPLQYAFSTPEISVKILDYCSFRKPLYTYYFDSRGFIYEQVTLDELVDILLKMPNTMPYVDREGLGCRKVSDFLTQNKNKSKNEIQHLLDELDRNDPPVFHMECSKAIQLVSRLFCNVAREYILSIKAPSWATDTDLEEYSATLRKLEKFSMGHQVTTITGIPISSLVEFKITDYGLNKLTMLKELCLKSFITITDNGISTLTNLTCLDLTDNWNITNTGLTDDAGALRFPKLKRLLLPNKHPKITKSAMDILEEKDVEIIENEYSTDPMFEM